MRSDAATRRQRLLELVAAGQPLPAAAEQVGVRLRSARRLLASPEARTTLQRIRDERLRQLAGRALAEAGAALAVLRSLVEDPAVPPQARVAAAGKLLDVAWRLAETVDLAERVARLEAAGLGGPTGGSDAVPAG